MIVYCYNNAGLFTEQSQADESPLEPGVFLLPAKATFNPVPEGWPDDKWPRFNGSYWELINKPTQQQQQQTPEQKLAEFLAQNPDVLKLIDGGANV